MASHHHSLLSFAALATTFSIVLLCSFSLNEGFSVDLIHRDSPKSPFHNPSKTHSQRVAKALRRSINRVNSFKPTSSVSPNSLQTDIFSDSGSGEYLMKYFVGTPPVPQPTKEFPALPRNGDLAVDTLTLNSTSSRPVPLPKTIIGCGLNNNLTSGVTGSGIVGLGGGPASLVSQMHSSIGGSTLTSFPAEFYSKFESAAAEEINLERFDDPSHLLSLYYNNSDDDIDVPYITAHFSSADVKLNPTTIFLPRTDELLCLAFRAGQLSIFGNLAQSNVLLGYDHAEKTVSFKPMDCTKL